MSLNQRFLWITISIILLLIVTSASAEEWMESTNPGFVKCTDDYSSLGFWSDDWNNPNNFRAQSISPGNYHLKLDAPEGWFAVVVAYHVQYPCEGYDEYEEIAKLDRPGDFSFNLPPDCDVIRYEVVTFAGEGAGEGQWYYDADSDGTIGINDLPDCWKPSSSSSERGSNCVEIEG